MQRRALLWLMFVGLMVLAGVREASPESHCWKYLRQGYCTDYVRQVYTNIPIPAAGAAGGPLDWWANPGGLELGDEPRVGAIAILKIQDPASGRTWGHTGIVRFVSVDRRIFVISQWNAPGDDDLRVGWHDKSCLVTDKFGIETFKTWVLPEFRWIIKGFIYPERKMVATLPPLPPLTRPFIGKKPLVGTSGTRFHDWGRGFTPSGQATLHFRKPDGNEFPTRKVKIRTDGTFSIFFTVPPGYPAGRLEFWAVDDATQRQSGVVSYRVLPAP